MAIFGIMIMFLAHLEIHAYRVVMCVWCVFTIPLFAVPILPFNEIYESLGAGHPNIRAVEAIARIRVPRLRQR